MKVKNIEYKDEVVVIQMESDLIPTYAINSFDGYISWGGQNNFPTLALNLFNNHPEHGAIVKGKTRYLSGTKIVPSVDSPIIQKFLSKANKFDDWYSLSKKWSGDKALYGGTAIQVITNLIGTPIEWHHLDMGKLRLSTCLTGVWFSNDWEKRYNINNNKTFIPFYKKGAIGESVYFYKDHTPSVTQIDGLYPIPDYASVLLDLDTDIEISNFFNSLVRNGFSAGHIITFYNGKMPDEKRREIAKKFERTKQGTNNAGKVVLVFTSPDGKGTEVTNITPNGLSEQYEVLNKRNENKIVRAHNVPRALFKMESEGSMGDRTVLDLSHELFINEFAKVEQIPFLTFIKKMCLAATGIDCDFTIEQVSPIGKELPLDNVNVINALNARDPNIISNYIIEKYGIKVPIAEISQNTPQATQIKEGANDSLKSLTGRQRGALDSIARKYNKGILTEQQAILQLIPFGFTNEDAKLYLGIEVNALQVQQTNHSNFLEWIKLNTVEIDEEDELVDESPYSFKLDKDKDFVQREGNVVPKKSFLQGLIDTFRSKDKAKDEDYDTKIFTVYKYGLRAELVAKGEALAIATTRDFCKDMIEATSGYEMINELGIKKKVKKRLTYEAISKLENDSEEDNTNAWNYRGGFWGKKPTCRHLWIGETYIQKIKK